MSGLDQHIEIVQGVRGPKARVAGSRIRVQDIAEWHDKLGMPIEQILREYPQLTQADVHAALAYYWDHHEEIERQLDQDEPFVAEMRQQTPSPAREKLRRLGLE